MGMHTFIQGIKPADEHFNLMLHVWKTCNDAGVEQPKEVIDFFGEDATETTTGPDPKGVVVSLSRDPAVTKYEADMQDGFDIEIDKLPTGIKIIRVINSY